MGICIYGLVLSRSFQDLLKQQKKCKSQFIPAYKKAQVQRQTPRSWDDYLKFLHLQIWAESTEDRHCRDISSIPHCHSGYKRAAPSPLYIKIWEIGRITVDREKESWFDVFKNSHSFVASKVVIILLIAGSDYDTEMLRVNNGQLYNRSIDPQNLRAKVDLGGILVKPSFYTDYRTGAWQEEMACQGLWE